MNVQCACSKHETESALLTSRLISEVRSRLPVVDRTLTQFGQRSIGDYLAEVTRTASESWQPRTDLGVAVYQYAAPLLGERTAAQVREELSHTPVVLTANHHGVDYFAQSVQSTLLFGLRPLANGERARTIPVLACGNIPLDNLTYPRGALLYGTDSPFSQGLPQRLPMFSNRVRRQVVSQAQGFDNAMVRALERKLLTGIRKGDISHDSGMTLIDILAQDYCAAEVLECESYSDQAVKINSRLWQHIIGKGASRQNEQGPALVYLELERVAASLLAADLQDRHSLAYAVMFDAPLRQSLCKQLDRVKGCWQQAQLLQRRENSEAIGTRGSRSCGTFLFWGIDDFGRRVPLFPDNGKGQCTVLAGVDDNGRSLSFPLEPSALVEGLQQGRLLPSLYSCFMVLAFARGITCAGGYYQAAYLPQMQRGLVTALGTSPKYAAMRARVAQVPCTSYLSGMQAVMRRLEAGELVPLGPVEMIAGGGLDTGDLQRILSLSVYEAHIASLYETLCDVAPELIKGQQHAQLAAECAELVGANLVIR